MTITLYRNNSENNRLSKQLETVHTYTNAIARNELEIIDPVIMIEGESLDAANYAYIAENNRYYFITKITKTRKNFYTFQLHCDVLMSFKDDLLFQNAIVSRSNGLWDSYLHDPKAKEKQFTRRACYLLKYNNDALIFDYTDAQPVSILVTAG